MTASDAETSEIEVNYVTLPGWKCDITQIRDYNSLPENARKYIEIIQSELDIPGKRHYNYAQAGGCL